MTSTSNSFKQEPPPENGPEQAAAVEMQAVQSQSDLDRLPHREPPGEDGEYFLHGSRPGTGQIRVLMRQQALQQAAAHSQSDLGSEVGGVLLGRAYRGDKHTFVEVQAALPAITNDHGPQHFTFNADAWARLHRDRAEQFPALDIVGWFHTHPDLGVFYSADDVVVHSAAFVMPWHVGLVVDPLREEASFFGWVPYDSSERTIAPLAGFYELLDNNPHRQMPWRVVRTAVWENTYEEQLARRALRGQSRVATGPEQWPALPPVSPWLGVAVGLAGILFSLLLLLVVVRPLNQQAEALEQLVTGLATEQMNAAVAAGAADCSDSDLRIFYPLAGRSLPSSSEEIAVVGTAALSGAIRYRLELMPPGSGEWQLIDQFRSSVRAGTLANWNLSDYQFLPGVYQMRLLALDGENLPLAGSSACTITFLLE